ncbi:hypothetical protein LR48_Vigan07g158400 [Vigna angularis]|uniref:Uncharacterized protein n=1 Tax=Phaseolus angularis TaxID=3914 RepID=A0A0L9UYE3_PHAAN|nr:hypothetical protein LR48_Vigan07g158400 [Vigna angularis]
MKAEREGDPGAEDLPGVVGLAEAPRGSHSDSSEDAGAEAPQRFQTLRLRERRAEREKREVRCRERERAVEKCRSDADYCLFVAKNSVTVATVPVIATETVVTVPKKTKQGGEWTVSTLEGYSREGWKEEGPTLFSIARSRESSC